MTASMLRRCEAALGPGVTRLGTVGVGLGLAALVVGLALGFATVTLGVLAVTWLFFAGAASGAVAFSAAVRCSRARWVDVVAPVAQAGASFFPFALGLLAVLLVLAGLWIPDAAGAGWGPWTSRIARDLVASALLFAAGRRYLRLSRTGDGSRATPAAVAYLLLYAAVLSLWAVDLVMSLHEWAPSTVIPPYYFMGAFLAAIAWVALAQSVGRETPATASVRHDLGKLLFAMVIMWGYLLWAAYLPVWYGNMPDETGQLLARWAGGWKFVSLGVLATVLAFPFFFLLPERTKRGRIGLTVAALSVLVGLFAEHFLLVLPSLAVHPDPPSILLGACVTFGVLGLFVLTVGAAFGPRGRSPLGAR
jgi:hypothetical protein